MFWRKDGEATPADPPPDSRLNHPPATETSEVPDDEPHQEDSPGSSVSQAENGFEKKLFEE